MKPDYLILLLFILNNACSQEKAIQSHAYTKALIGRCSKDTLHEYFYILPEQHSGRIHLIDRLAQVQIGQVKFDRFYIIDVDVIFVFQLLILSRQTEQGKCE